ncbi:MAG: hypothetical protein QXH92_04135 [Candidatus Aenigmatarchaeota archaeon]
MPNNIFGRNITGISSDKIISVTSATLNITISGVSEKLLFRQATFQYTQPIENIYAIDTTEGKQTWIFAVGRASGNVVLTAPVGVVSDGTGISGAALANFMKSKGDLCQVQPITITGKRSLCTEGSSEVTLTFTAEDAMLTGCRFEIESTLPIMNITLTFYYTLLSAAAS